MTGDSKVSIMKNAELQNKYFRKERWVMSVIKMGINTLRILLPMLKQKMIVK